MTDFLEHEYLEEQVKSIKEIGDFVSSLTSLTTCRRAAGQEQTILPNSAVLLNCSGPAPVLVAAWDSNGTHFWLELTGQTLGWMAFGISPTGRMDMSDVLFGWCDDDGAAENAAGSDQLQAGADSSARQTCYAQVPFRLR